MIHYVDTFIELKGRSIIKQEIENFLNNIKQPTTQDELEVTKDSILKYVTKLTKIHMNLVKMLINIQTGSKMIYPNTLEGKIRNNPGVPLKVEHITTKYKAWHQYLITELHVITTEL